MFYARKRSVIAASCGAGSDKESVDGIVQVRREGPGMSAARALGRPWAVGLTQGPKMPKPPPARSGI